MAITIDWGNRIINVPRNDMTLIQSVPTEIRQLNINSFRLTLNDLEDDAEGMPFPDTHRHNTTVEVGGVILARVVEIINGYTVTFEDGQYAVNLVGANSNIGDVTNVNQVSVRSANSAGLQDLSTLLSAAYNGEVVVNLADGQAGTDVPVGTRSSPVNNFPDAVTIANRESINVLRILGNATMDANAQIAGKRIVADSAIATTITIEPAADVTGCAFEDVTVTGTLDGGNEFTRCNVQSINYVNGFIFQCALQGTITLGGAAQASILDCWSNVAGGGPGQFVAVDMGGSGNSLALRNYSGGLNISNYSGGGSVSLDFSSGRLLVEPTVTSGEIYVRGIADVTDNSTGTAAVFDQTVNQSLDDFASTQTVLGNAIDYVRKLLANRAKVASDDSSTTIYDDDKTTPLLVHTHPSSRERVPP